MALSRCTALYAARKGMTKWRWANSKGRQAYTFDMPYCVRRILELFERPNVSPGVHPSAEAILATNEGL